MVPILSKEITFHPINKIAYFIYQPTHDHRVKISSELYDFIQIIDNKTELKDLVLLYNLKYDDILTDEFAYDFLYNKLAKYGIIESKDVSILPSKKPNYLKLSFIIINEKKVSKLTKYLSFLFSPMVFSIVLIVSMLVLSTCFYFYRDQIFSYEIKKGGWFLLFILGFIGIIFHELGHASATHYYGAKHGGIGAGFYLFIPVFYADVTDIWKLPKRQRIMVNLAGVYFELLYGIFLILTGFIFRNQVLIFLVIFSLIWTFLDNLSPFGRADGYWILSDIIERPNLMIHSEQKVKEIFKSKKLWNWQDYLLLFYGLTNYCFILLLFYFVVVLNPHSILYFPQNLIHFIVDLFTDGKTFSIESLFELMTPIVFIYLVGSFLIKYIRKGRLLHTRVGIKKTLLTLTNRLLIFIYP
ncbi:peptidase, M50 family protein [Flavobacterium sp. LAR06]|uniref:peptidase, M50 family protein n=1 Tax=Flavobacterium sp. LAR06 TaxID=3064897 RepID=UPI0035C00351